MPADTMGLDELCAHVVEGEIAQTAPSTTPPSWDDNSSLRQSRSSSVLSAGSAGSIGVITALVSRNREPRRTAIRDPTEALYYLQEFEKTESMSGGMLKVTKKFKWVQKRGKTASFLSWFKSDRTTVAKYSFTIGKEQYRAEVEDGRSIIGFAEFQEFHILTKECGQSSEGVSWRDAMILTSAAKSQADAIAARVEKGCRHDTHYVQGKIWSTQGVACYPREDEDDW